MSIEFDYPKHLGISPDVIRDLLSQVVLTANIKLTNIELTVRKDKTVWYLGCDPIENKRLGNVVFWNIVCALGMEEDVDIRYL